MMFELTEDMKQHLEIDAGELYLLDNDTELLKMNTEYRNVYGTELFIKDDFMMITNALKEIVE